MYVSSMCCLLNLTKVTGGFWMNIKLTHRNHLASEHLQVSFNATVMKLISLVSYGAEQDASTLVANV